jgi:MoaA/NifB/PqqE/SkfB family radical SAM enzyme
MFSAINPHRYSRLREEDRGFFDFNDRHNLDSLLERVLTVHLFGFGEPTIHPNFADMIRYVSSFETQVEFLTNWTDVNEDLCRLLVEQRVRQIMISISGSTKTDYEGMYLNGNFEKVLNNIATLGRLKKEAKSAYPVIFINSIGFKHHIEKLPDFIDLMADRGVNIISVHGLIGNADFPETIPHAAVYNPERDAELIAASMRRAEERGVILTLNQWLNQTATSPLEEIQVLERRTSGPLPPNIRRIELSEMKDFAAKIKAEHPKTADKNVPRVASTLEEATQQMVIAPVEGSAPLRCMEPFRVAYVRRDGNVTPCCLWTEPYHSFGNVATMSGTDIWNSHAYRMTRDAIIKDVYPQGCHFCVKSRCAPEDPQLYQAQSFIEWYRDGYGIDLSESFQAGPLRGAGSIIEGLRSRRMSDGTGAAVEAKQHQV